MAQKRAGKSKAKKTKTTTKKTRAKDGHVPPRPRKASSRTRSRAATEHSTALDLYRQVFRLRRPLEMARSLRRSVELSRWRKPAVLHSAVSIFNNYASRAERNLPGPLRRAVHRARQELRKVFDRPATRA